MTRFWCSVQVSSYLPKLLTVSGLTSAGFVHRMTNPWQSAVHCIINNTNTNNVHNEIKDNDSKTVISNNSN